jgi:plasmid maintenance system killer protein
MDIIFGSNPVRRQCQKAQGKLKRRLDDIRAAENLSVLQSLPGRCHALKTDRRGQWAMDLDHPKRLVFEPFGEPLPLLPDGRLDVVRVTAIVINEIVDYHG